MTDNNGSFQSSAMEMYFFKINGNSKVQAIFSKVSEAGFLHSTKNGFQVTYPNMFLFNTVPPNLKWRVVFIITFITKIQLNFASKWQDFKDMIQLDFAEPFNTHCKNKWLKKNLEFWFPCDTKALLSSCTLVFSKVTLFIVYSEKTSRCFNPLEVVVAKL